MLLLSIMFTLLLLGLAGAVNGAVVARLLYAVRLLKMQQYELPPEEQLPSVTVCIPARNEIHGMTPCLDRVVSSDYPKLEIIVLDDESRDETSILIKSYAAAGVRFIEGKPLPEGWLGKNYAQSVLAREASGSVVLFMDVDTLIQPHTISRAVAYMLAKKADMVSFIPTREDTWRSSVIFATLRHFWTLLRFSAKRPRAASNAWLVKRQTLLEHLDNDPSLPLSVQVETTIARALADQHSYRLVLSDRYLGLSYEKKWRSQVETSIRLLYPQSGNHWYAALSLVAVLGLLLFPYVAVWYEPWALVFILFQYVVARVYLSYVWARHGWIGALVAPVIIAQEIILIVMSMWKYMFGVITWKGRPITRSPKS